MVFKQNLRIDEQEFYEGSTIILIKMFSTIAGNVTFAKNTKKKLN